MLTEQALEVTLGHYPDHTSSTSLSNESIHVSDKNKITNKNKIQAQQQDQQDQCYKISAEKAGIPLWPRAL